MAKPARKGRGGKKFEPKEFEEVVIEVARVNRVMKGGRRLKYRTVVVIGDRKGRVGVAVDKASEVPAASKKAITRAKRNMIRVPLIAGSIPHNSKGKYKSTEVLLMSAPKGTGVIAGGPARVVCDLAGIQNVLSKRHGSGNRLNVAMATMQALESLQEVPGLKEKVEAQMTAEEKEAEERRKKVEVKSEKKLDNKKDMKKKSAKSGQKKADLGAKKGKDGNKEVEKKAKSGPNKEDVKKDDKPEEKEAKTTKKIESEKKEVKIEKEPKAESKKDEVKSEVDPKEEAKDEVSSKDEPKEEVKKDESKEEKSDK